MVKMFLVSKSIQTGKEYDVCGHIPFILFKCGPMLSVAVSLVFNHIHLVQARIVFMNSIGNNPLSLTIIEARHGEM